MAAISRATARDIRTWAPRKLIFTASAFWAMKITSTIRARKPPAAGPNRWRTAVATCQRLPAGAGSAQAWRFFFPWTGTVLHVIASAVLFGDSGPNGRPANKPRRLFAAYTCTPKLAISFRKYPSFNASATRRIKIMIPNGSW